MLKPQDIVVLMKIIAKSEEHWAQAPLAFELGMSASEVNAGIKRLLKAGLVRKQNDRILPIKAAVEEFLVHGLKYAFPAERGEPTRGLPTAHAAGIFKHTLVSNETLPPVWPDAQGDVRGYAFKPLYRSIPYAVKEDAKLYDFMAIIDVLRSHSARDRQIAKKLLKEKLKTA